MERIKRSLVARSEGYREILGQWNYSVQYNTLIGTRHVTFAQTHRMYTTSQPKVSHGLWVMMCQCKFEDWKKMCPSGGGGVNSGGNCACVGDRGLYLLLNIAITENYCEKKVCWKIKPYLPVGEKKTERIRKWVKDMNRHFTERYM